MIHNKNTWPAYIYALGVLYQKFSFSSLCLLTRVSNKCRMFRLAYKSDKLRWNGNIILNEQSQLPIWLFIKLFAILIIS